MASLPFKEEIQGLRGLSVAIVVLFHLGFANVPGGFVGVDVFFVISGYLITGKLIREYELSNTINFRSFYEGRAWRLMPALIVTTLLTFSIAAFLMTPSTLKPLAQSALASFFYVSNIYFWQQSGYFDPSSINKPLLHLWSLSIEEQFYFLWPLLLLASLKTSRFYGTLLVTALTITISYTLMLFYHPLLALLPLNNDWIAFLGLNAANTKFFLLPFRLFEFALGASVLFYSASDDSRHQWRSAAAQFTGLVLITISSIHFTERTDGPYLLLPCLGAMLVIIGGNNGSVSKLLINPVAEYLGRISYSLYLIHWPVIVFYSYIVLRPVRLYEKVILAGSMVVLAHFMYRLVETRWRKASRVTVLKNDRVQWLYYSAAALTAISALSAASISGWPWRYGEIIKNYDISALSTEGLVFSSKNGLNEKLFKDGHKVLIVGDSHGADVANGLFQVLGSGYSVRHIAISSFCLQYLPDRMREGMIDPNCKSWLDILSSSSSLISQADRIIITFDWLPVTAPSAGRLIVYIKQNRIALKDVLLLGSDIHYPNFPEIALRHRDWMLTNRLASEIDTSEKTTIDRDLEVLAASSGILFERKIPLMCGPHSCNFVAADSSLNVWDEAHWTLQGARIFMAQLSNTLPAFFFMER